MWVTLFFRRYASQISLPPYDLFHYGISQGAFSPILSFNLVQLLVQMSFHNENAKRPNKFKKLQILFLKVFFSIFSLLFIYLVFISHASSSVFVCLF